jgi:hypothetical protein
LKPKYKEYGKNLGGPMLTVHYPQFCFDKNPYGEPEGMKPGPTYIRPKEKEENILPPGYIVPTGPGKWVKLILEKSIKYFLVIQYLIARWMPRWML